MKKKVIIYVLCYDDHTEKVSHRVYGSHPWCRVFRLPAHHVELESSMYTVYLDTKRSEWEHADYVGTISWKAFKKIPIDHITRLLRVADPSRHDVVPFFPVKGDAVAHADKCHPGFALLWERLLSSLGCPQEQVACRDFTFFACNYWMCRPRIMNYYIRFAKQVRVKMEDPELREMLYNDARYPGSLSSVRLTQIFGHPWYTFHPFIFERLPGLFFTFL